MAWDSMQCNAMGWEGKGLGIDIQGIGKARIGFMVYNDISLKYHGSKERNRTGQDRIRHLGQAIHLSSSSSSSLFLFLLFCILSFPFLFLFLFFIIISIVFLNVT